MTRDTWRLGHRPGLDGLRGIAVLLVVVSHSTLLIAPARGTAWALDGAGAVGVTVFFTLSGFLITSLLLDEWAERGSVDLRRFYARRALRLLPALAVVLSSVAAWKSIGGFSTIGPGMFAAVALYSGNWYLLAHHADFGGPNTDAWVGLGHTWSLAIEEQFYLLWPLTLLLLLRRGPKAVLRGAAVGAGLSLLWGALSGHSRLDTAVSAWPLLVGCGLSAWLHLRREATPSRWWTLALVGLAPLSFGHHTAAAAARHVLVPVCVAAVIWVVAQAQVRGLEVGVLRWFGRRSYGLYLWHYPVFCVVFHHGAWQVQLVSALVVSIGLAALSWRFIEEPILRHGRERLGLVGAVEAPGLLGVGARPETA